VVRESVTRGPWDENLLGKLTCFNLKLTGFKGEGKLRKTQGNNIGVKGHSLAEPNPSSVSTEEGIPRWDRRLCSERRIIWGEERILGTTGKRDKVTIDHNEPGFRGIEWSL